MKKIIILCCSLIIIIIILITCNKQNRENNKFGYIQGKEKVEHTVFCRNNNYGYSIMIGTDTVTKKMTSSGVVYVSNVRDYGIALGQIWLMGEKAGSYYFKIINKSADTTYLACYYDEDTVNYIVNPVPYTLIDSVSVNKDFYTLSIFYPYIPYFSRKCAITYYDSSYNRMDSFYVNVSKQQSFTYITIPKTKKFFYLGFHTYYLGNGGKKSYDIFKDYSLDTIRKTDFIDTSNCLFKPISFPLWK